MCIRTDTSVWYSKDNCVSCGFANSYLKEFFVLRQDELFALCETLSAGDGNEHRRKGCGKSSATPLMVMDPRQLFELLAICTLIAQGQKYSCLLSVYQK